MGSDLLNMSMPQIRSTRANSISMIFHEPMASLNPVYTVGNQTAESVITHHGLNKNGYVPTGAGACRLLLAGGTGWHSG